MWGYTLIKKEELIQKEKYADIGFRLWAYRRWFSEYKFLDPIFEYFLNHCTKSVEHSRDDFKRQLELYLEQRNAYDRELKSENEYLKKKLKLLDEIVAEIQEKVRPQKLFTVNFENSEEK